MGEPATYVFVETVSDTQYYIRHVYIYTYTCVPLRKKSVRDTDGPRRLNRENVILYRHYGAIIVRENLRMSSQAHFKAVPPLTSSVGSMPSARFTNFRIHSNYQRQPTTSAKFQLLRLSSSIWLQHQPYLPQKKPQAST